MKKGKNFSCNNIDGKRRKSDFYQTPYSMTEQLLENEKFDYSKKVLECACGELAIVKILRKKFNDITAYDINMLVDCDFDFLNENDKYNYIITNPPFSKAFEFIQKAKEIAKEKFAFLLPLSYLHGQKRFENNIFLDNNYPLTKIYVFTRYPLLSGELRPDGKYNTGMMVYAWFIWYSRNYLDKRMDFERNLNIYYPVIKWIDNNKYVLKKGDK